MRRDSEGATVGKNVPRCTLVSNMHNRVTTKNKLVPKPRRGAPYSESDQREQAMYMTEYFSHHRDPSATVGRNQNAHVKGSPPQ